MPKYAHCDDDGKILVFGFMSNAAMMLRVASGQRIVTIDTFEKNMDIDYTVNADDEVVKKEQ